MSRYAIVAATFYRELADRLLSGAGGAFEQVGAEYDTFEVPGAFELAPAAAFAARSGRYAGVACVGAVIRGETDHYDFVCQQAAAGIMRVQLDTGVPCSFGVLTCDSMEQALARSGGDKRDQGRHAAEAVLALDGVRRSLENG